MLPQLNFPTYEFRIEGERKNLIFDEVRKKFVALTPEEWVRQHMISYFIHSKNYPIGYIGVETALLYGQLKKRADIVVYSRELKPHILVECKSPVVDLNDKVIEQAARYYFVLQPGLVVLTNGLRHVVMRKTEDHRIEYLKDLPEYSKI